MAALQGRAGSTVGFEALALSDGTVLAVRDTGPGDAPVTVVLHHGWTQDHSSWEDVAGELKATHRVIFYDARGHGRSDAGPRGSATLDQLADDLAEVISALVPTGPVVVAGHSLGGPVLLAFVRRHPELTQERIAGVALVATSAANIGRDILGLPPRLTAPVLRILPAAARIYGLSRARRNTRFPVVVEHVVRLGLFGPGNASYLNRSRTARQVARSHPETTAALAAALVSKDWSDTLAALADTPTVVLAGTNDGLTPIAHSRAIAAALPSAKFVVYPGIGHMLPYEVPADVAREIAALSSPPTD